MNSAVDPHPLDEDGYIVAWRHKSEFKAGKFLDEVMSHGEAKEKAEALTAKNDGNVYWAEPKPQEYEPH